MAKLGSVCDVTSVCVSVICVQGGIQKIGHRLTDRPIRFNDRPIRLSDPPIRLTDPPIRLIAQPIRISEVLISVKSPSPP